MLMNVFEGILIPFVGTTLGAACVFLMWPLGKRRGMILMRILIYGASVIGWK